jgi:hypothetical protein
MAEGVVLHPAPAFIECLPTDTHDMERIDYLHRVREVVVEHRPVGLGQIQRRMRDRGAPRRWPMVDPRRCLRGVASFDNIKDLSATDINEMRRPPLGAVLAIAKEQHVIDTKRAYFPVSLRVVDEHTPVSDDGVVHRVPVRSELTSNLSDRATSSTDLPGRPPPSPSGHDLAWVSDAIITNGP